MDCVVVMGVSGSGKSTLGRMLAEATGRPFAEGDDLHPPANVAKLSRGEPLTDEDRAPWLDRVAAWMRDQEAAGVDSVVACSALKRAYRDRLREVGPGVQFCLVTASRELLESRLAGRKGHFMPPFLLDSQLATFEPLQPDEPAVEVFGDGSPEEMLKAAVAALRLR